MPVEAIPAGSPPASSPRVPAAPATRDHQDQRPGATDAASCEGVDRYDAHERACGCDACLQKAAASGSRELTEEEEKRVEELKRRDAEVRRHEAAHKAAAGQYARGGPQFEYETGPDGKPYAVGGEVSIDTSPIPDDPRATIRKAEILQRAALAPQDPSDQDRRVAAEAAQMKAKAQKELAEETGGNPLQVRVASYAPASPAPSSTPGASERTPFDREA